MIAKSVLVSVVSLAFVSGCASMSKSECASANWETRGSYDAQNGSPLSLLSRHNTACAKIGVTPNAELYRKGHEAGARLYCTPRNGLKQGRLNADYNDICPVDLEPAFLSSFIDGLDLKLIRTRQEKSDAESKLFRLRLEQAAFDGPVPKDLLNDIEEQESKVSTLGETILDLVLRISELRLQISTGA